MLYFFILNVGASTAMVISTKHALLELIVYYDKLRKMRKGNFHSSCFKAWFDR